ncbi:hypothetical protein, partial [Klebsiella pneumoniae]
MLKKTHIISGLLITPLTLYAATVVLCIA